MSREEETRKEGWDGQRGKDKLPTADYYGTREGKRCKGGREEERELYSTS